MARRFTTSTLLSIRNTTAKSRHSRENGNLEALVPIGFEFMKQALQTRLRPRPGDNRHRGHQPSPRLVKFIGIIGPKCAF